MSTTSEIPCLDWAAEAASETTSPERLTELASGRFGAGAQVEAGRNPNTPEETLIALWTGAIKEVVGFHWDNLFSALLENPALPLYRLAHPEGPLSQPSALEPF